MAGPSWWVSTGEIFENREGTPFSSSGNRQYVRYFKVRVNTFLVDSVMVCLFSPGIPAPYEPYTNPSSDIVDWLAVATDISAKPQDNDDYQIWIVTVKYSTGQTRPGAGTSGDPKHPDKNKPEDEEPEVEWDSEMYDYALQEDLDGKLIVNKANDPFVPAPMEKMSTPILRVTRNESVWNRTLQMKYGYVVNKDIFLGAPIGSALMMPPKAKKVFKGNYKYWRVSYTVKFLNPLEKGKTTWQLRILNAGMRELKLVTIALGVTKTLPVPIFEQGHKVTHPVLLDKNGKAVQTTLDAQGLPVKVPFWLDQFTTIRSEVFAPLKLDQYL